MERSAAMTTDEALALREAGMLPEGALEACAACGHSPEAHCLDGTWAAALALHEAGKCQVCAMFGKHCPGFRHLEGVRLS